MSNKTREIEGFVQTVAIKAFEEKNFNDVPFWREIPNRPQGEYQEAKLVIKAKEKEITLSESQFDEMWNKFNDHLPSSEALAIKYHESKQKLFGESV